MRDVYDKRAIAVLKRLAAENDGLVKPEQVVHAARPKESPLHRYFEWNNSKAAEEYRIIQARNLLRVIVEYTKVNDKNITTRVFCSLTPDRVYSRDTNEGGYRPLQAVLTQEDLRAILLKDAKRDAEIFTQKYHHLSELAQVFKALKKVSWN